MDKIEKELLIKDLSARVFYGVKVNIERDFPNNPQIVERIGCDGEIIVQKILAYDIYYYKPYLRSMSSMTEEENAIFNNISNKDRGYEEDEDGWVRCDSIHTKWGVWPDGCAKLLDYLNSIHIDYRGLIEKGLALEATDGMYND